ncbi:MAG: HlyD family efflux transporter periplasmic adaptor subunit [Verrucomicrobiia bacterium]
MSDPSINVRELGATRPRTRSSLRFTFQEFGGQRCCVVEDPLTSKFHRLGLPEYRLLTHLDGKTTFAEAFARASLESGQDALNEQEAVALLHWLVENHLADFGSGPPDEVLEKKTRSELLGRFRNFANLLFIKIPLGRPDPWLERLLPKLRWLCGPLFFGLWSILVLAALLQLAANWSRFIEGTEGILTPSNWLWLGLVWILLKAWHEFWHGLVCKYHGGPVREAGLLFVLFTPMGYIDASSSWTFPSKWKRIHVAAAGVYGELAVAALATLLWAATGPGLPNTLAMNTMIMASTVTLLFNLNPLMKFDGYFILSDLLEIPNLAPKSTQILKQTAKRYLLAVPQTPAPDWSDRLTYLYLAYGLAALLWRLIIMATLLITASLLFKGGGLLLALVALALWLLPMAQALVTYLRQGSGPEQPRPLAAALRLSTLTAALALLLLLPLPVTLKAPGIVQYANEIVLRAESPGIVLGIHTTDGALVDQDQLLLTLANPDLETELARLAIRHDRQNLRTQLARNNSQPVAAYEAELATLSAYRKQYEEKRKLAETLDLRAPVPGRIIAPRIERLRGRFLQTGDEILRLARPHGNEVLVPVPGPDIDWFRRHLNFPVLVHLPGRRLTTEGILKQIGAKATTDLQQTALTSLGGGPLPVKKRSDPPPGSPHPPDTYELVQPVFLATVDLPNAPVDLRSGEPASIKFTSRERRSLAGTCRAAAEHALNWLLSRATPS